MGKKWRELPIDGGMVRVHLEVHEDGPRPLYRVTVRMPDTREERRLVFRDWEPAAVRRTAHVPRPEDDALSFSSVRSALSTDAPLLEAVRIALAR